MAQRNDIIAFMHNYLDSDAIHDYCPNGLQVEGKEEVNKIVSGVTASLDFLNAAVAAKADMVLVHHGWFWKNEPAVIKGAKRRRHAIVLANDVSLVGYHLPLDKHPEVGNNVQLAQRLGLEVTGSLPCHSGTDIGCIGRLETPMTGEAFASHIANVLEREPLHVPGDANPIETVAWCTGGAQHDIVYAVAKGVDAFITGEASESTVHTAREEGIHFFAAGHHATERYGVQALGEKVAAEFGIQHEFIDCDNPV